MCLDKVDAKPECRQRIGWKVFGTYPEGLVPQYTYRTEPYPVNTWLEDKYDYPIRVRNGGNYPAGFHIYADRDTAYQVNIYEGDVVRKVKLADVVATGKQETFLGKHVKVIVARKMFIIEGDKK